MAAKAFPVDMQNFLTRRRRSQPRLPASSGAIPRRMLVVDDDPTIREMLARALSLFGNVDQAAGGIDAMRQLGLKRFDAILMDLHMPGFDGFAVMRHLGVAFGRNHDTPVLVISADTSAEARVRALRRAVFFVSKPLRIAQLHKLIDGVLAWPALAQ